MYGNSSIMTDKDLTFFGDQEFLVKDLDKSIKECTKNSSNPERVYKELNSEITKARETNMSSTSRNNEIVFNDQIIDPRIWGANQNDTQDSNQYFQKYELLRKKEKGVPTPKNIGKGKNIFIVNNNYDYSLDTEEFGMGNIREEMDEGINGVVNRISSIQIKNNNINKINEKSKHYLNTQFNGTPSNKKIHCVTEPDEYHGSRPYFPGSFINNQNMNGQFLNQVTTPQKRYRQENYSMNFMYNNSANKNNNNTNNNIQSNLNYLHNYEYNKVNSFINNVPNFPQLINNKSTGVSERSNYYSSNNKKNFINFEEGESVEYNDGISVNEENYINMNFMTENNLNLRQSNNNLPYHQSISDKKVRLPTSESIESNNSAQFNYFRNNPNLIGMNLSQKFASNGNNVPFMIDEENNRNFSGSFNEPNYLFQQGNLENAFSVNNNFVNSNCNNQNMVQHNDGLPQFDFKNKRKINKHSNSENINNIKLGNERNILNLEDIIKGKDNRTTIMIRNIPIKYSDEMLLKELEEFNGKFDCLYLPYDYEKKGNRGYAFINFVSPFHILLFYEKFEGKSWNFFESRKICELNSAKFQGINEIRRHAKNYKGEKKPSFFFIAEYMSNMEIPMKYKIQLIMMFPNIKLEDVGYGVIKIKSFGK